jgi:L-arabinose isomerase
VTGSQYLYGDAVLARVDDHARAIAADLFEAPAIPVRIVSKPVVTTPDGITAILREADATADCIGVIAWMHTFSPAKMWIAGLSALRSPLVHLHTQFNRDLPWAEIDMDFMNLNQSAHGDREFAFVQTRLRRSRKTIVGHWQDPAVRERLGWWARAAAGWHEAHRLRIARFGDNMREVAVTEGDKVEAQARFGFSVNGYGISDLVTTVQAVTDAEVDRLVAEYEDCYDVAAPLRAGGDRHAALRTPTPTGSPARLDRAAPRRAR